MNNQIFTENKSNVKKIIEIKKDLNYATKPQEAILEDGTTAIVKLFNGTQFDGYTGNFALFNEFVSYKLANLIDIPMPESGICLMDEDTKINPNSYVGKTNYGYGFYSKRIESIELNKTKIEDVSNKEIIIRIILFDHIISNGDRNAGNILIHDDGQKFTLMIIDHSHAFNGAPTWDSDILNNAMNDCDYQSGHILQNNETVYGTFCSHIKLTKEKVIEEKNRIKDKLTEKRLETIIQECPDTWRPSLNAESTLIKYIMYRIRHIEDITSMVIKYLKDKGCLKS